MQQPGLILTKNTYENLLRLEAARRFIRQHGIGRLSVAHYDSMRAEFNLAA